MTKRKRRPKRPRNPFVPLLRRMGAKTQASAKAYNRRAKHRKPIETDRTD